jgi:hypothetical protein
MLTIRFQGEVHSGKLACCPETHDARDIFCAGSQTALVARAEEKRCYPNPATDIERIYALGRIELVARDGQEVNSQLIHARPNLTHGLCRIGVNQGPALVGKAPPALLLVSGMQRMPERAVRLRW